MRQIQQDVTDFLAWMEENGKKANTVRAHRYTLDALTLHCHVDRPDELTPDHIRQFRGLIRGSGKGVRTMNEQRLRVKSFLEWCHNSSRYDLQIGRIMYDWQYVKPPPQNPAQKVRLTDEQYDAAMVEARKRGAYLPLFVALNCELGLDGSTCADIMIDGVDMVRADLTFRRTKTGEWATVRMPDPVLVEMELWLREYQPVLDAYKAVRPECRLLPRRYWITAAHRNYWRYVPTEKMGGNDPASILGEIYEAVGVTGKGVGARAGRRRAADTIAREAEEAGEDGQRAAQELLQHRDAGTTLLYMGWNPGQRWLNGLLRRRKRRVGLRLLRRVS